MLLSHSCATLTPLLPSMPAMPVGHATTAPPTACRVEISAMHEATNERSREWCVEWRVRATHSIHELNGL